MRTAYNQIINVDRIATFHSNAIDHQLITRAQGEQLPLAAQDRTKTLLLAIDIQHDFMEGIGTLAVDGSKGDVHRLTQWMYRHLGTLTHVICSLDCHSINQIFHAAWWVNSDGAQPEPFTIIGYEDVANSTWTPSNGDIEHALAYLQNLETTGKKRLCIWPYHCLEGTFGAQLESQFTKMLYFHSAARQTKPTLIYKGQDPNTEMYGIIKAEYDRELYINQTVLDAVRTYDNIYIAGQASSHCVLASAQQILEHYRDEPSITSRITLLVDCMSAIAGFESRTQQFFELLRNQYGIQIKKSTDVHF